MAGYPRPQLELLGVLYLLTRAGCRVTIDMLVAELATKQRTLEKRLRQLEGRGRVRRQAVVGERVGKGRSPDLLVVLVPPTDHEFKLLNQWQVASRQ